MINCIPDELMHSILNAHHPLQKSALPLDLKETTYLLVEYVDVFFYRPGIQVLYLLIVSYRQFRIFIIFI
jgi:hypothetical protein